MEGQGDRNGFVLIEMVVVVAIVALLAALLAPVYAAARKQVYQFDCASRQRQLAKAVLMYSQDFDEGLPVGAAVDYFTDATGSSWDAAVIPYTTYHGPLSGVTALAAAGAIYRCPADRAARVAGAPRSFAMPMTGDSCLGSNRGVIGDWVREQRTLYTKPRMLAELSDQSGTLLLVEFFHPYNRLFGAWAAGIHGPVFAPGSCGTGILAQQDVPYLTGTPAEPMNHLGGSNYVFADSHARWLMPAQTFGPRGRPGDPQGMWTIAEDD
jgi:prepilin-type N-terminal cleavage/methylation domain-containing protein/prepilin-type processing-associated H-X9-DG protein